MAVSFLDAVRARRTYYALDKSLASVDGGQARISAMVKDAIQTVPSGFNSQTNRAVVLFGDEHDKLWDIVADVLKSRVSEDQWVSTEQKTAGFKAAAGTILFFIDTTTVSTFATNIPSYAALFPTWAAQSDAMLQHTLWTALEAEGRGGLGANLQHYNPIIDGRVADAWDLPRGWQLTAQLVFGGKASGAGEPEAKEKADVEGKVRVFGA